MIGTIFGGAGLKAVEKYLNRDIEAINERKDYRDEIRELRDRLDKVEAEVDEWKAKYFHNEEEIVRLRATLIQQGIEVPPRA